MRYWFLVFALFIQSASLAQEFGKGLLFNDQQYRLLPRKSDVATGINRQLPDLYSLKLFAPRPGNQMQLSNGPAWAIAYAAQGIIAAKFYNQTNPRDIARNYSMSPAFLYANAPSEGDDWCRRGVSGIDILQVMNQRGGLKYADFPVACVSDVSESDMQKALSNRSFDFLKLYDTFEGNDTKLRRVKLALAHGHPVVWGFHCPPSFSTPKVFWQPREAFSSDFPGHMVCIVGYDDKKYGGSFEVINSWTANWGNEGFMWIRYADFLEFGKYAFEVFPMPGSFGEPFRFQSNLGMVNGTGTPIKVEKAKDQVGLYRVVEKMKAGDKFTINLETAGATYTYIFATDDSKENFSLFPDQGLSPLLNEAINKVQLPTLELEEVQGKDYICILYASRPLNMEQLFYELEKGKEGFPQRLTKAISTGLAELGEGEWKSQEISFNFSSNSARIVPLIIEISH